MAATATVELPDVAAPDLSGLVVTVPAPAPITADQVLERLNERLREGASRRDRAANEGLAPGDDVQLTVIGYANQRIVPSTLRVAQWSELRPIPTVPGFFERLVEVGAVGKRLQLNLAQSSGLSTRFLVSVLAARAVEPLDPDDAAVLRKVGLGSSINEAVTLIIQELEDELVLKLQLTAQRLVLEALAARTKVRLSRSVIDAELALRWRTLEASLEPLQFDTAERVELMSSLLDDPALRAEAEQRLTIALALRAIAKTGKGAPTADAASKFAQQAAATAGAPAFEAPELLRQADFVAHHFALVDHVMRQATVTYTQA